MKDIVYRVFDKNTDKANYLDLFRLVYGFSVSENYFDWKFENNPGGPCYLVVAVYKSVLVGFAALTPYKFWIDGRECVAAQGADTMVHPDFRKQGIFTELTRKLFTYLHENKLYFRYSAPGPMSFPGYIKLGSKKICKMPYMFRLNPWNKILKNKSISNNTANEPPRVCNLKGDLCLKEITRADKQFDSLDSGTSLVAPIKVKKDSTYVNWRYIDNPIKPCKILGFYEKDKLTGYAAVRGGYLIDVIYAADGMQSGQFIKWLIRYFDSKGIIQIETWYAGDKRIARMLRSHGFIKYGGNKLRKCLGMVEDYPLVAYVNDTVCEADRIFNQNNWYITMGDIDCM